MAADKTRTKKKPAAKAAPASSNGKPAAHEDSIRRHLSKVHGVEAVYTWIDPHNIVHVVSVVKEHDSRIYDRLIPGEERVEKDNPKVFFDFHVRMRQNRELASMLPSNCTVIFNKL